MFPDFEFFDILESVDFGNVPLGFGIWDGVQSIDTSSGIQLDGFSARTEPPGFIFDDFDDVDVFACVFGLLRLPLGGPKTTSESPKAV